MSNQLKYSTSPYLLQHAENPVNWYMWSDEAFETAKKGNKPIFLSIGYSTCHWCHVMAHESFEDEKTAEILNKYFVSIKVDREERPDIDSVYMAVCQAFTGSGGWPTSIFLTWDKKPFFAGTYFPVRSQYGMPGFSDLLMTIAGQWEKNQDKLLESADEIIAHLKNSNLNGENNTSENIIEESVKHFKYIYDSIYGGFGRAPKFPTPHNLLFLMMYSKISNDTLSMKMVEKTLIQMRKGGIFDHIGGGFSRYSTDKYFLAPHFEKMLYDNALLIMAYSSAYSMTKTPIYLETAEKTANYIIREMTSTDGGFYSAQDADSDGVEGKYYTFTRDEILNVLGKSGQRFAEVFDITANGNFEGVNIPNLLKSNDLESDFSNEKRKLYDYRKQRTSLQLDDKILLSWNAMMIAVMSMLYRISKNEKYLKTAKNAQQFLEQNLCNDLLLYTSFRDGKRSDKAFLDDYAYYVSALIELYNSTLDRDYLNKAELFCSEAVKRFTAENGGFFLCQSDNSELFMNPKEVYDGAIPSGNSVMAYNFVRLYQLTEDDKYRGLAEKQIAFLSEQASDYPAGHSLFLLAKLMYENQPEHVTIVQDGKTDLSEIRMKLPLFANISVVNESKKYPLLNKKTTYYVCRSWLVGGLKAVRNGAVGSN